jgi:hypothetical protein
VSPDSIVPDPANPQSLNRYSYVLNRPLVLTDPSGHMPSDGCEYEGCLSDPDSWGWGFIDYLLQNTDFNDPSDNPAGQIIVRTFDFILPLGMEDAAPINEIVTEAIVGSNSLINQGMNGWYPLASPSEVLVVTGAFIVAAESEAGDHLDGGGSRIAPPESASQGGRLAVQLGREESYSSFTQFGSGSRTYYTEMEPGRVSGSHRYALHVDASENVVWFRQEIFDDAGNLVSVHVKLPVDTGHIHLPVLHR